MNNEKAWFAEIRHLEAKRHDREDEFCKDASTETLARLLFRMLGVANDTYLAVRGIEAEIESLKLRLPE